MVKRKDTFITKLSLASVNNLRFTVLVFLAILMLGWMSYTTFLKREGFPNIQVPVVLISGNYQVNDKNRVDREVTSVIESQIARLKQVDKINSTTLDNSFTIIATLTDENTSEDGQRLIRDELSTNLKLPEGASYSVSTVSAGKFNGEYDMIINVYRDGVSIEELQTKSEIIASELSKSPDIVQAKIIPAIQTRTNPANGQKVKVQESFTKYSEVKGEEIKTYDAISIGLIKREAQDVIRFSDSVQKSIDSIKEKSDFNDYNIRISQDFAPALRDQISSLESNAIGSLLVVGLLIALIINLRSAIVVASFVAIVLAATMISLYVSGNSLNIISLFAVILVLGIFVDDATVVVEAIQRNRSKGLGRIESVRQAINSIGVAKIAGTVTTLLVFIPMAFISGVLGDFIRLIPTTVITILIISLFLALTVSAGLSALLLKTEKKEGKLNLLDKIENILNYGGYFVDNIGRKIADFVNHYIHRKAWIITMILISFVLIGFGSFYASKLEFSIFPQAEDGKELQISITSTSVPDIKFQQSLANQVNELIGKFGDNIENITYEGNALRTVAIISLKSSEERAITSTKLAKQIESELQNIPNSRITVSSPSAGPPAEEYPFKIQIFSDNQTVLENSTREISDYLKSLTYKNRKGQDIKVSELVVNNIQTIVKRDNRRFASIEAKFDGDADTQDILAIQNKVAEEFNSDRLKSLGLDPETGIGTDLGSESKNLESFNSAIAAFWISIIVMYAYLVAQYRSYTLPILIFTAIPFSFPLLFPGLYLTGNPLSFFVSLGIIALAGIVVNNTIILVDTANEILKETGSISKAISDAIAERFRPILVTSLTTIGGLLPLALSDPFWEGLALSIVFGLASSLIMVVLFFPAYYGVFQGLRRVFARKILRREKLY